MHARPPPRLPPPGPPRIRTPPPPGGGAARLDLLPLAQKFGADYTIGKPFNVPELVALVDRALSN